MKRKKPSKWLVQLSNERDSLGCEHHGCDADAFPFGVKRAEGYFVSCEEHAETILKRMINDGSIQFPEPEKPEVEFKHWIEPEDIRLEGNVQVSGNDEDDRAQEQWVLDQLEAGNDAAWCQAMVTAKVVINDEEFEGRDSLGACSWPSERELWKDQLAEMKANALDDLFDRIRASAAHAARGGHQAEPMGLRSKEDNQLLLVVLDQLLEDPELGKILARTDSPWTVK